MSADNMEEDRNLQDNFIDVTKIKCEPDFQFFESDEDIPSDLDDQLEDRAMEFNEQEKLVIKKFLASIKKSKSVEKLESLKPTSRKKRVNKYVCKVSGCENVSTKNRDLKFYRFPKDKKLKEQWLDACRLPNTFKINNCLRVCELHFKKEDLSDNLKYKLLGQKAPRALLNPGSIPSLNLQKRTFMSTTEKIAHEEKEKRQKEKERKKLVEQALKDYEDKQKLGGQKEVEKAVKMSKGQKYSATILKEKEILEESLKGKGQLKDLMMIPLQENSLLEEILRFKEYLLSKTESEAQLNEEDGKLFYDSLNQVTPNATFPDLKVRTFGALSVRAEGQEDKESNKNKSYNEQTSQDKFSQQSSSIEDFHVQITFKGSTSESTVSKTVVLEGKEQEVMIQMKNKIQVLHQKLDNLRAENIVLDQHCTEAEGMEDESNDIQTCLN